MRLLLLPIALIALAATPARAGPPSGASEALVERFIAVLPDSQELEHVDRRANPTLLEPLGRLNPGREEEIRSILSETQACLSAARNAARLEFLRNVARSLGDEKLRRLIALYAGGPDLDRLRQLMPPGSRGTALTPAEAAELERIKRYYALDDYHAAFKLRLPDLAEGEREAECARTGVKRLEQAGIRLRRDQPAATSRPD